MKTILTRRTVVAAIFSLLLIQGNAADPGKPSRQYNLLQTHLQKFEEIKAKGGWGTITPSKKFHQQGQDLPVIIKIKERLAATGDYTSSDMSTLFTPELAEAVKKVQTRYGFPANGVVDAALVKQLNIPVEKRIRQLEVNMERLANEKEPSSGTRLIANIPEFKLHVYEGDRHMWDMDIVVGKESNKTVIFSDEMKYIVFSPSWHVPPSIVRNEILPHMRNNRNYLWRNNYVQTGTENGLPVIKQLPGPKNALGQVKFIFPNSHNIYFHDTPAKGLFELRRRAFSHGCIRLAEPAKLAEYLLRNDPSWTPEKIQRAMDSGREQQVNLAQPVAVSITYYTAWVDGDGLLHFREDIYGHDK